MSRFNLDELVKIEAALVRISTETSYAGPWNLIIQHGTESPEVLEAFQDARTAIERAIELFR